MPDWQSSLYFADVYSCWEVTWHIVNYARGRSRFCFRRPARFFFFVWPWLVILWARARDNDCWCFECGTQEAPLALCYLQFSILCFSSTLSGWLQPEMRCEPPRTKNKTKQKKNIDGPSVDLLNGACLFILFIFNNICFIFWPCEVLTHFSECQELMYEGYCESTYSTHCIDAATVNKWWNKLC